MISTVDFPIVGSYNNQRVAEIDTERSINLFEYYDKKGKKPRSLINTSGLTNTGDTFGSETGAFRQQFVFTSNVSGKVTSIEYGVVGTTFYKATANNTVTVIASLLSTNTNFVGMAANTFQIMIVDGVNGYIYDTLTGLFKQITDPSFPTAPIDCCYLDGFFIVANGGTNTFQVSSFNEGLVWGPDNGGTANSFTMAGGSADIVITYSGGSSINNYQVGTPITFTGANLPAELVAGTVYYVEAIISATTINVSATNGGTPIVTAAGTTGADAHITNNGELKLASITSDTGTIVACRTLHRRLFLFSQFFCEVWENNGAQIIPFRRNNSLLMEYGTPAIGSISVSFDLMIFQSQSREGLGPVMMVSGVQPIPISTRALDFQLSAYDALQQISDCYGFMVKDNGLIFYRMNFTAANHTFVYNVTLSNPMVEEERLWHEEEVLNGNRHPAQTNAYLNGINYLGSYLGPTRYILDSGNYTNDGEAIRRARITAPIVPAGYQRTRIDRLQIDFVQGHISSLNTTLVDVDLLAETGDVLDTELAISIILDNQQVLENPQNQFVFISISKDGGQTYGYNLRAPMGFVGQRSFRTLWRKLGVIPRGQAFVMKMEFYHKSEFAVMGAAWAMEVLPE
jgi:hypothetical protein